MNHICIEKKIILVTEYKMLSPTVILPHLELCFGSYLTVLNFPVRENFLFFVQKGEGLRLHLMTYGGVEVTP